MQRIVERLPCLAEGGTPFVLDKGFIEANNIAPIPVAGEIAKYVAMKSQT